MTFPASKIFITTPYGSPFLVKVRTEGLWIGVESKCRDYLILWVISSVTETSDCVLLVFNGSQRRPVCGRFRISIFSLA